MRWQDVQGAHVVPQRLRSQTMLNFWVIPEVSANSVGMLQSGLNPCLISWMICLICTIELTYRKYLPYK